MSLVGRPPKLVHVDIEVDTTKLVRGLEQMRRSFAQIGRLRESRAAKREAIWREPLEAWENEDGALEEYVR